MKNKKNLYIYLVIGVMVLIFIVGGWYTFKFRECVKNISYVPPRQQGEIGGGFGFRKAEDNGDYYRFDFREFKTSDDALRACMWK